MNSKHLHGVLLLSDDSSIVARSFLDSIEGLDDTGNVVDYDSIRLQTWVPCFEVEYLTFQSGVTQEV